jgi:hypothetical protein
MKTLLGSIVALIFLAIGLWAHMEYKEDKIIREQLKFVSWERADLYHQLMVDKIGILKTLSKEAEKEYGKLSELHTVELEYLPEVIEYRWRKHQDEVSFRRDEAYKSLTQSVETAIKQILFTKELLRWDQVSEDYPTFSDIIRDKTSFQMEEAHDASFVRLEEILSPLWDREREIINLSWEKIPLHKRENYKARQEMMEGNK